MKNINNVDFLKCIYKNADMGIIGIDDVIVHVNDSLFESVLRKEREEYENIKDEAEKLLKKYREDNDDASLMSKVSTKVMSEMMLLNDKRVEHIAKMMLEGTNKGIIEIVENINAYDNNDPEIINLANKYQKLLENNIEELKKYL